MLMKPTPAQVRAMRFSRDESQIEAASQVGVSYVTWQRWENKGGMGPCEWAVYRAGGLDYLDKLARGEVGSSAVREQYFAAIEEKLRELNDLMDKGAVTTREDAQMRLSEAEIQEVDALLAYRG